jgi:hypothetical protein
MRTDGRKDRQTDGWTDREDKAHRPFFQFFLKRLKIQKNVNLLICVKEFWFVPQNGTEQLLQTPLLQSPVGTACLFKGSWVFVQFLRLFWFSIQRVVSFIIIIIIIIKMWTYLK